MSPERLRDGLVRCGGPAFSLRRTARAFIQHSRASRRATGAERPLRGRAALDRLLDLPHHTDDPTLSRLADQLRMVARGDPSAPEHGLLDAIEAALSAAVPRTVREPVSVEVGGWPPGIQRSVCERILGHAIGTPLPPQEAALLVHRLHGQTIGGHTLRVRPQLDPGWVLPAPPRAQRGDRGRRGRAAPWLAHLDPEGTRSLTPRPIAEAQARLLGTVHVHDACCGCGANAIACALHGARVSAWELSAARARLARANVRAAGVADRVRLQVGDGLRAAAQEPADALFVDPPWEPGGVRLESWDALRSALPSLEDAVAAHPVVMLKLPRTFAVDTLPGGPSGWRFRYELGSPSTGDAQTVRMITAWRKPAGS